MGRMDIFCASQAATAIRLSMEEGSSSSSSSAFSYSLSSTAHLSGSRAIDRHNPIIGRRIPKSLPLPPNCTGTSQSPPVDPIPYNQLIHQNHRKSSTSSIPNDKTNKKSSSKTSGAGYKKSKKGKTVRFQDGGGGGGGDIKRKSCAKLADMISPPGSSRYLLDDSAFFDVLPDFDPVLELVPVDERAKSSLAAKKKTEESSSSNPKTPSSRTPNQEVVVLRVSLHCKGCEGKVRKHISRMQGVTSFDIDFAAKKVTVEGDITQSDVLASISKVKNAQLWAPPAISSCSVPAAAASEIELPRNQEMQRNWCVK